MPYSENVDALDGPKIVVIGGGTGLSTMLRGLKKHSYNITAIVTVADDGGGSGDLRNDLGMLPPGDVRNCILALANTEPVMKDLLNYRFKDGRLKGQSFGNLFLAAMNGISINFEDAVQKMSSVLAVRGTVLPVTLDYMELEAVLENGEVIKGESNIPKAALNQNSRIKELRIIPQEADALGDALVAIEDADAIILGPGSLYTSVLPNLLVRDITRAIQYNDCPKIYICNVMTQPGETTDFTVSDHVSEIIKYCGENVVDTVIANIEEINDILVERYNEKNSQIVKLDRKNVEKLGINIVEGNLVEVKYNYIRHDANALSELIIKTIMERQQVKIKEDIERM